MPLFYLNCLSLSIFAGHVCLILPWSPRGRASYTKFSSEGGDAIKDAVCNYIDEAGVVALQDATKLPDLCTMADFKACKIQDCPFVILVKTTDTDPFTLLDKYKGDPLS